MTKRVITTEYEREDGQIVKKTSTEEFKCDPCEDGVCEDDPETSQFIEFEEDLSIIDLIIGAAGIMSIIASACAVYRLLKK